jgi:hypothetical protein
MFNSWFGHQHPIKKKKNENTKKVFVRIIYELGCSHPLKKYNRFLIHLGVSHVPKAKRDMILRNC